MICIAMLLDDDIQNDLRKIAVDLNRDYKLPLEAALLPSHISMKLSFNHSNLDGICSYVEELFKDKDPLKVTLSEFQLITFEDTSIIWIDVDEDGTLKDIHNQLNDELMNNFDIPLGVFDGDQFAFHTTLSLGQDQMADYKNAYESSIKVWNREVVLSKVGIFYSPHDKAVPGSFLCYRVIEL